MKIFLAIHHFPPRYNAGAENYAYRLARWLLAHGHTVEVVCIETIDYKQPAKLEARYEVFDDIPVWRLHLGMGGAPYAWQYNHPQIGEWLQTHLGQSRPDLVHLHSGYLIGANVIDVAHGLDIPTVVTLHDFWFLCPRIILLCGDGRLCERLPTDAATCAWCTRLASRRNQLADSLTGGTYGRIWQSFGPASARDEMRDRRTYLQRMLRLADLLIAPSPFVIQRFKDLIPEKNLHLLTYGISVAATPPAQAVPRDDTLRLGYLGQIAPHKGVHTILAALKQLPAQGQKVELHIYGGMESSPGYGRQLQRQAGAGVFFHGRLPNSEIAAALQAIDVLVVSSIWYEVGPMTIMEANAIGRPVLACAIGNIPFIVRDDIDGLLYRAGDPVDLARQIQRLREDPALLARLSASTRPPKSVDTELSDLFQLYSGLTRSIHV